MLSKNAVAVKSIKCLSNDEDPIREYQFHGEISEVQFTDDNFLQVMYEAIDTNIIEGVDIPSMGVRIWLDEEGKLKETTEVNIDASIMYQTEYATDDFIFGHVVFTSIRVDDEGYTEGLNEEEKKSLLEMLELLQTARPSKGVFTKVLDREPRSGVVDG